MEEEVGGTYEGEMYKIIKHMFGLPDVDIKTYSPLTLAYIGDVVYDMIIRTIMVGRGNAPVSKLNQRTISFVNAAAQKDMLHAIEDVLTEEEWSVYKRGRNAKPFSTAKNASLVDYKIATGYESLIGYLYMTGNMARVLELMRYGMDRLKGK